jgi:cholesterol transport system auxiliary component
MTFRPSAKSPSLEICLCKTLAPIVPPIAFLSEAGSRQREESTIKQRMREFFQWDQIGKLSCVTLVTFALAGCASEPLLTFDLDSAQGFPTLHRARSQLVIDTPSAGILLASQRIVIRTGQDQVAYLKGSQWAAELPSLVHTKLLGSFENAHLITNVGNSSLMADRHLQTEIRSFDANVLDGLAHVELVVRLSDSHGRIVAGKIFSAQVPLRNDDDTNLALALNQALGQTMHAIVIWTAPKI